MAEKEGSHGWLADLGVTIHEVLRYCYGGLLAFLIAALIDPTNTKTAIESLTAPVTVLIAFALGGAIYAAYRPLAEWLFVGLEGLHSWRSKVKRKKEGYTCVTDYFVTEWGISLRLAREAFRIVRYSDAFDQKQKQFYLQHSELHTVFVTAYVLGISALVVAIRQPQDALVSGWTLLLVAAIALSCGSWGDTLLCRQECKAMLLVPKDTIRELLVRTQFIPPDGVPTTEQKTATP